MTAGFTELLTKQVTLTGTETDLGALFGESTGKVRLSVPDAATSSVWLGKKGVSTSDDEYKKGTQTQLPTTSLRGWYAITNGASVTVTIAMATGGVDAPDWITAGTNGASTGGGGGGDATAANQVLGLTALDQIYDALQLIGTEATSADILAAVQSLGGGATLADLATALAPLATEATQQDVLAALEAQGLDIGLIQTNVALLVPDLDDVRIATQATATATGTTADADTQSTLVGLLKWVKARLPTALTSNDGLKTGLVEPIPNGSNTIGAVTGSGNFASTNAAGSQVDGHSASIGTTTDADTTNTLIGRAKKMVALLAGGLPAALGGGGGLKSEGVGVAGTPAGGITSVQGVAGGTALTVAGSVTTSAPANTTATGNLTALNDAVSIVAGTGNAIGIQLTGTWSGTVAFEASFDGGSTWVAVSVLPVGATTMVSSTTANGNWSVQAGGLTNFRTRRSVATSGTAAAALVLTNGQRSMAGFPVVTQNPAATNWTISTNEIPTFAAMLMVNNQSGGANMVKGDTLGVPCFQGRNPESNTSYGNPVAVGYKNGSGQSRVPLCDASDRTVVSGGAAAGASVSGLNPIYAGGSDGTNARGFTMKAANPLAADYGTTIREIPLQKSSTKTTAGTPAASLVVRAGPCWLFDVFVSNQSANAGYLTVYDLTSAPTHGAAATARKIPGRHIDTKVSSDPFNFKEDFGGLYFATGCVLVIENAEDDANTNTTGAQTMTMNATFVAGT